MCLGAFITKAESGTKAIEIAFAAGLPGKSEGADRLTADEIKELAIAHFLDFDLEPFCERVLSPAEAVELADRMAACAAN